MWAVLVLATLSQARPALQRINFEPDAGFARVLPAPWPEVISGAEVVTLAGLEALTHKERPQRVSWRRTLEQAADVEAVKRLVLDPAKYVLLDSERCRCGFIKLCGRCDPNLELTFERGHRRVRFRVCFHCSETGVHLLEHGVEVQDTTPDLGDADEWLRVLAALVPDDDLVADRKRRHDEVERRRREDAVRRGRDAGKSAPSGDGP